MSKKFFSLIHGDPIHLAPTTKVIPAETFSSLLDAKEVLGKVQEDAEKYRQTVALECEKLKGEAKKEGFEQGYTEWVQRIADLEKEIKKVRGETEKVIVPIAIKAAKKIVGRELETSEKTVVDIVTNSLKAVATHKKIKIYVNKKELDLIERHKNHLKNVFERLESLSILSQEEIKPGGCIIETEGGIINAQLENQWMIFENAFQKILASKKPEQEEEVPEPEIKKEPPPKKKEPAPPPKKEVEKEVLEEEDDEDEDDDSWEDEDWEDDDDEDEEER